MKFMPIESDETSDISKVLLAKMQKAMSVIQFKLESAAIRRNPGYGMDSRMIVDTINIGDRTALLGGVRFPLNCSDFPTIGQAGQSLLTKEEEDVIQSLRTSFMASEKLQRHAKYLLSHGSVYLCYNGNLLMHAGLPIDDSLNFREVSLCGQQLKGKALLDFIDRKVRQSFSDEEDEEKDLFWFLWCSPDSPLFGKDKMATFERYFIDDKSEHKESTPLFYRHLDDEALADALLKEFGLAAAHSHIVCGHVPVKAGESPIKANGKILCIDLGYSQAYQKETGLAGCTLTYNSIGLTLMLHEQKKEQGAAEAGPGRDMSDRLVNVEELGMENRLRVSDTEDGKRMQKEIDRLEMLLEAYSRGTIAQSNG
jgi:fructose-1,6-bisphosphatase-3